MMKYKLSSLSFVISLFLILTSCKSSIGTWIEPKPELEIVGVHASLLPNGKVLTFSYADKDKLDRPLGRYQIWDPITSKPEGPSRLIYNWNPFCSGHSILGNSQLFVAGGHVHGLTGHSGANQVGKFITYNTSGAWIQNFLKMDNFRWYPSVVTLANGDAFIIGGSAPRLADNWKDTNNDYEYFSTYNNRLIRKNETDLELPEDEPFNFNLLDERQKVANGKKLAGLYPLTHLLPSSLKSDAPNGLLFVLTESFVRIYNPTTNEIINNKIDVEGFRTWWTQASSNILPINIDIEGNGPEFIKIMVIGGGSLGKATKNAPALNSIKVFKFDIKTREVVLEQTFDLNRPRFMGDGILLPDGNVILLGGAEVGFANDNSNRVGKAELVQLDESGNINKVIDLAESSKMRGYHSSALLLPDASIFVCGGNGNWKTDPFDSGPTNEFKSIEIFKPPYINDVERPLIKRAPDTLNLVEPIEVIASGNELKSKIVMVRHGSRTHSLDTDQRVLNFFASKTNLGHGDMLLKGKMPNNPSLMPPGPYMLYVLDEVKNNAKKSQKLVPSVAKLVYVSNNRTKLPKPFKELRIKIYTGNDNLEHDNRAYLKIKDKKENVIIKFQLNQGDIELPNNSVQIYNQEIGQTLLNELGELEINHIAKNCDFCHPDNWNINRIIIDAKINGVWENIMDEKGNPRVRLSETYKNWRFPL